MAQDSARNAHDRSDNARSDNARRRILTGSCAALAALLVAGCADRRPVADLSPPADYRVAHPIVLRQDQRSLDVLLAGGPGAIGARQIGDIRAFAAEYRRKGAGPLVIAMPSTDPSAYRLVPAIRRALAEGGVTSPRTASYLPGPTMQLAPVRLSFSTLQAKVASTCGQWPSDIGGNGGTLASWENRPWENYGCATQTAMAAQIADPLDLVRPRPDAPPSAARTATVIGKYNKGEATSVIYPDEGKGKINQDVGN